VSNERLNAPEQALSATGSNRHTENRDRTPASDLGTGSSQKHPSEFSERGPGGELALYPRIILDNHEAIAEMTDRNQVLNGEFKWRVREWLHPETEEERSKRTEQEQRDLEEMRRKTEAQRVVDLRGPTVELRERNLGQWTAQVEDDERQRMETPPERKTRERRQDIRNQRNFLKQDAASTGS
jgi:hypothetical protein